MFKCFDNLEKYADAGMNCLLVGRHGIGKTMVVKDLFTRKFGNNWKYFSCSTLDVWCDFVGIPRDVQNENGEHIIEYVKPKWFDGGKIEAIFLDEFNRSVPKLRNAIMELLQFKELNGQNFGNLKTIFAAINPEDDEDYSDIDKLDKAHLDRFEVKIECPYNVDIDYFIKKYGIRGDAACEWWQNLDEKTKKEISPRRLEHSIKCYSISGNLRDFLPHAANISTLISNLKNGTIKSQLEQLLKDDDKTIKEKLKDYNLMTAVKEKLCEEPFVKKCAHLLSEEIIMEKAPHYFEMCQYIKKHSNKFNTSLIATLDKQGCFTQSDFNAVFVMMNKSFGPTTTYVSRMRNKLKKILQYLPDVNKCTIKPKDINNLQRLIDLTNGYCSASNYGTVEKDNKKLNFISKFANIKNLSETTNLGLNFNNSYYYGLDRYIDDYIKVQNRLKEEEKTTISTEKTVALNV